MVRLATGKDLDEVIRQCVDAWEENGWMSPIDPAKMVDVLVDSQSSELLWVEEYDHIGSKGLVGSIGLVLNEPWYSRHPWLTNFLFYVEPLYRSEDIGKRLVAEAREEARRRKLPLCLAVENPGRMLARGRIATYEGFWPIGEAYMAEIGDGEYIREPGEPDRENGEQRQALSRDEEAPGTGS